MSATVSSRQNIIDILGRNWFWILVIGSVLVRLIDFNTPFAIGQFSRQSQTGMTVYAFLQNGYSLLNYQTPLFGPPWQVPFELPIFQTTMYAFVKLTGIDITLAGRITGMLYFYLTALYIYKLSSLIFESIRAGQAITLYFLWMPFGLLWSRTSMIDLAAAAFSVMYTYYFGKWLLESQRSSTFTAALIFGICAYVSKITTMFAYVVPIAVIILYVLYLDLKSDGSIGGFLVRRYKRMLLIGVLVFLPLVFGYAWVAYADAVKSGSTYVVEFTSKNLRPGIYGSIAQRLNSENWSEIVKVIFSQKIPYFFLLGGLASIYCFFKLKGVAKGFLFAAVVGCFMQVLIPFNLHHTHVSGYYMIAIYPLVAIFAGYGIFSLYKSIHAKWALVILSLLLFASYYKGTWLYREYLFNDFRDDRYTVGKALRELTPEGSRIAVLNKFSSAIIFQARRFGWTYSTADEERYEDEFDKNVAYLKEHNFGYIIIPPAVSVKRGLYTGWKNYRLIDSIKGYEIYQVSDTMLQ